MYRSSSYLHMQNDGGQKNWRNCERRRWPSVAKRLPVKTSLETRFTPSSEKHETSTPMQSKEPRKSTGNSTLKSYPSITCGQLTESSQRPLQMAHTPEYLRWRYLTPTALS